MRAGARLGAGAWHAGMAAVALGLGLAPLGARAVALAAAAVAAVPLAVAAARGGRALALLAPGLALLVLTGGGVGVERLRAIDAPAARVAEGGAFRAEVVALGGARPSPFGESVEVGVRTGPLRGARLLVRVPRWRRWPDVGVGRVLELGGRLRRLRTRRGGEGAAYAAHLRRRGVAAELALDRARATGERRDGPAGVVDRMRERSERAIDAGLAPDRAALLRGMVLGQDEDIARPVRDDFRASGLAHLLAVSGQNVMLLAALALPLLALAGLAVRARCAVLLALIAVYVPLAGAGPSLQRAGVMGAAGVVALAASRPASRVYALLLAAACTLALSPRAASDPGWQLSFAAVAGIVWLVPPLQRVLREVLGGAPGIPESLRDRAAAGLADGVALTLVATLATAPLLAHHFGSAPVAGLPANLLALPAVAPAMWLGMLEAAVGQLALPGGPVAAAGELLAAALGRLAGPPVGWIATLAERFADMPGGQLRLPLRSAAAVGAAYVILITAVALLRRRAGRLEAAGHALCARWRRAPRATRTAALAAALGAFALVVAGGPAPRPPKALTVRFLDVGQGDATLIQHPDGAAVLFDAGPPEADVAGLLREAGVRRLSIVVATHASRDHHGGLAAVVRRFPVELVLDGGDGSPDPELRRALGEAGRRGARTVAAVAPLTLRAGHLRVDVLSPPPRPPGKPPEDPNPRAVVAVVSAGDFELLLSGDAESEALAPLDLPDVDAMKVAHHGSADPGLPALLERVRPELAAIEVGAGNGYGHPAPSTLAALRRSGVQTRRTDRHGTVTLTAGAAGLRLQTERGSGSAAP